VQCGVGLAVGADDELVVRDHRVGPFDQHAAIEVGGGDGLFVEFAFVVVFGVVDDLDVGAGRAGLGERGQHAGFGELVDGRADRQAGGGVAGDEVTECFVQAAGEPAQRGGFLGGLAEVLGGVAELVGVGLAGGDTTVEIHPVHAGVRVVGGDLGAHRALIGRGERAGGPVHGDDLVEVVVGGFGAVVAPPRPLDRVLVGRVGLSRHRLGDHRAERLERAQPIGLVLRPVRAV
jgi:hypothetical protein